MPDRSAILFPRVPGGVTTKCQLASRVLTHAYYEHIQLESLGLELRAEDVGLLVAFGPKKRPLFISQLLVHPSPPNNPPPPAL